MPDSAPPGLDEFIAADAGVASSSIPASTSIAPNSAPAGLDDFIAPEVSAEKYGTPLEMGKTALEGGARGLTFGLSDLAEEALLHNAKERAGRLNENPITATGSQVLGAALPIIATGGGATPEELAAAAAAKGVAAPIEGAVAGASRLTLPYLASRAGQAVEHAAGEGVLGRVLGLGTEGAAFGAGNAVSDAALGDPHLTAQKVISDIGMGAAFGAGLGVLSKGVEAALPSATKKLTSSLRNMKELLFGTEESPTLLTRAMSVPGSFASGENPTDWNAAFMHGLNGVDRPRTIRDFSKNMEAIYKTGKEAAADLYETAAPTNIGRALEAMPIEQAKATGSSVLNEMATLIERPGDNGDMISGLSSPQNAKLVGERLQKLSGDLNRASTSFEVHDALNSFAKELDRGKLIKFDTLPTAGQMADQEVLRSVRNAIRGNLKNESLWGEAAQHYAQTGEEYGAYRAAEKNFQQAFMRKEPATKSYFVDPSKVAAFFNRTGDVSQDVKSAYLNDFLNRATSLSKASENYYGFKAAENSISARVSTLAKQNQEFKEIAEAIKSRAQTGGSSQRLGELGIGYAAHAVGVPNPVIGAAIGTIEAYKAVKNPYELGSSLGNTFSKLQVLGDLAESVNKRISSLSRSVFGAPEGRSLPAASIVLSTDKGYAKRAERVEQLASNPDILMKHLDQTTGELHEAAPNVSEGIHSSMISAVQFLNSKIPRPPNEMVFSPEWEPSRAQKEQFQHYYDTIDNPLSVFKEVKNGTLSNQAMEALKTVYPKLLTQMQQSITENLNGPKLKNLNYGTKISLSKFLGQPLCEGMMPKVLASNQAALAAGTPPPPPAKGQGGKVTLGGLKELDVAARTEGERQEDRDNET